MRPVLEVAAGEFGAVVEDDGIGIAALAGDVVEHQGDTLPRQREIDEDRGAFAGAIVFRIGGAELEATGQHVLSAGVPMQLAAWVGGEVHRPALVGGNRTPMAGHGT